jgi:hypothetical protein
MTNETLLNETIKWAADNNVSGWVWGENGSEFVEVWIPPYRMVAPTTTIQRLTKSANSPFHFETVTVS